MKNEILNYIKKETIREIMEDKTTKQIADHFEISTQKAYDILCELSEEGEITKLDPVNNDKFSCCGWIRNDD